MLRIKLVKSTIGHHWRIRRTVQALGIRKVNHVVEHEDTPTIRGMIQHVWPLLKVEEVEGNPAPRTTKKPVAKKARTVETVTVATSPAPKAKKAAKPAADEAAEAPKPKRTTRKKAEEK